MPVAHRRDGALDTQALRILAELGFPVPLDLGLLLEYQKLTSVDWPYLDGHVQGLIDLGTGVVAVNPRLPRQRQRFVICR